MKKFKSLVILACIALTLCGGCKFKDVLFWKNHDNSSQESGSSQGSGKTKSVDEVKYADLNWTVGGENGSKAQLTSVLISDLKVSANGISWKWKQNDLSVWGYAKTQADARTCFFYKKDGKWKGGFFEWDSTSRTSRDFKNIKGKYKGWNWADIPSGAEVAVVILSKDCSRRTNVLKGIINK